VLDRFQTGPDGNQASADTKPREVSDTNRPLISLCSRQTSDYP